LWTFYAIQPVDKWNQLPEDYFKNKLDRFMLKGVYINLSNADFSLSNFCKILLSKEIPAIG